MLLLACAAPIVIWGSRYPPAVLEYWLAGGAVAAIAFVVASRAGSPRFDVAARGAALLAGPRPLVFGLGAAAAATGLALLFAIRAFARSPSTPDEIAQLWHAKILMHGHLSLPVDPNREFFGLETVVDVGRWYSQFPIGGPLALVPGAVVGAPWLVNPVLLGIAVAALYRFARRAYGEIEGRAITALFVIAPMVLILAGTWMNHVPVLCLTTIALALVVEWEGASSARRGAWLAAALGAAVGLIATIRPLDAVAVAAAIGALQLFVLWERPARWLELPAQIAGGLAGVLPLLVANRATTGSAFRFGYDVLWGAGHRAGFHTDPYGNVHTIGRALDLASSYVGELNMFLLAWPVPAILVAVATLLATRRLSRWDGLMLALFGAQLAAYGAYWGDGQFLGPRFLYTALPAVLVLIARAPFVLGERFGRGAARGSVAAVLACIVIAWAVPGLPYNVLGLESQAAAARGTLHVDLARAVRDAKIHNAIVFLREPFTMRLERRLWGLGFTRSDAAQLIAHGDACSILAGVRAAEADTGEPAGRSERLVTSVVRLPGPAPSAGATPVVRVASRRSITPECQAELDADKRLGGSPFGPALPLEEIGPDGRVGGDIVYAADLGDRNEVLRTRFSSRAWYRLSLVQGANGRLSARVDRY